MVHPPIAPTGLPRPMVLASVGLLTKVIPRPAVIRALRAHGKYSQRERLLPAPFLVYLVIALSLYMTQALREVLRCVLEGMRTWERAVGGVHVIATKGAMSRARLRLGPEVLETLFEQTAQPIALPETRGAWYRQWRVMILDGSSLALQDTPQNVEAFGRPHSKEGEGAFPMLRLVGLVEAGTHAVVKAAFGAWSTSEMALADQTLPALHAGMLLLEDRGFVGYEWWRQVAATGAQIVCRVRRNMRLPCQQRLPDGSFLSVLRPPKGNPGAPIVVRVIEYTLPGVPNADPLYRLVTTLLDPEEAPAQELAALYHERWEVEGLLDEFKTHLRGGSRVSCAARLRLGAPRGVGTVVSPLRGAHRDARRGASGPRRPRSPLLPAHRAGAATQTSPGGGSFPPSGTDPVVPISAGGSAGGTSRVQPRPTRAPRRPAAHQPVSDAAPRPRQYEEASGLSCRSAT